MMATNWMIEAADDGHEWRKAKRRKKPRGLDEKSMFSQVEIPATFAACQLDQEVAEKMREKIENTLPAGDDRDLMIAMILGRGDGLEDGWTRD